MTHQGYGYHQQLEMVKAYQAELRDLRAEQRLARQAGGGRGLPSLVRWLLRWTRTQGIRWAVDRRDGPVGRAPVADSSTQQAMIWLPAEGKNALGMCALQTYAA